MLFNYIENRVMIRKNRGEGIEKEKKEFEKLKEEMKKNKGKN